jgi:AraC family transcriptional regulator
MTYAGSYMGSANAVTMYPGHGMSQFGPAAALLASHSPMHGASPGESPAIRPVPASIVGDEAAWRLPPNPFEVAPLRVRPTRWESSERRTLEVSAETAGDGYVVGLALRSMDVRFSASGRVIQDGVATPGMMHVSEPSASAHCLFRGPYDALHLHVPNDLLNECAGYYSNGNAGSLRSQPAAERDPIALQLGLALLNAAEFGNSFGQIYADGISLAIVTRLLALQIKGRSSPDRTKVAALSKWRLKRAIEFIDAHLGESVSLADVAAASGLSRMHFAAQFKAATGCRPHDYLLQRRISRAQELMVASAVPLVEVSLQVGFQSQAHFTTVFKRIVGQPPHAWRQSRTAF